MIIAKIFACTVLFLLAVLGLSLGVRILSCLALGRKRGCLISVVLLDGTDTEFTLRCALAVHGAQPLGGSRRIYAVDCGMNAENRFIAQSLAERNPCLRLLGAEEFFRRVQELGFPEYFVKAE